jgi:hypothetical protein
LNIIEVIVCMIAVDIRSLFVTLYEFFIVIVNLSYGYTYIYSQYIYICIVVAALTRLTI